jgi:hypothetical protein
MSGSGFAYVRLYADDGGDPRFEDVLVPLPPGSPLDTGLAHAQAEVSPASTLPVVRLPAGWSRRHNAPAKQWVMVLAGTVEVRAGEEVRRLLPGAVVLAEDTVGTGHTTTAVDDVTLAVVRL